MGIAALSSDCCTCRKRRNAGACTYKRRKAAPLFDVRNLRKCGPSASREQGRRRATSGHSRAPRPAGSGGPRQPRQSEQLEMIDEESGDEDHRPAEAGEAFVTSVTLAPVPKFPGLN